MSIYVKPCLRCRKTRRAEKDCAKSPNPKKDRRQRKTCADCRWIAISPPSLGRRSLGAFLTLEQAQKAERDALQKRDDGIPLPKEKLTLLQLFERFSVGIKQDAKKKLAPATIARYEEHWKHHVGPSLAGVVASKLTDVHISELLDKLGSEPVVYVRSVKDKHGKDREKKRTGKPLSGTSLVRVWSFMHCMLGWAQRKRLVGRNVATLVDKPNPNPSKARALTTDEAAALLALADGSRFLAFLLLALTTGCRRGELAALQWDCVDLINRSILVRQAFGEDRRGGRFLKTTKSGHVRRVPLAAAAVEMLKAVHVRQAAENLHAEPGTYSDQGFVFADKFGRAPDLNGLSKEFAELAKLAGIKGVTLHSCRHFMATSAIVEGSDINSVSAVLGHSQPSTTLNVYGHFQEGGKSAAVQRVGDALAQAQARHATLKNRATTEVKSGPEADALQPNCNQSEDVFGAGIG